MRFIVIAKDYLTAEEYNQLGEAGSILYESRVLPIIGIEASDQEAIRGFGFISSVYPSRTGQFSSVAFTPSLSTHDLKTANMVGWQIKIAILDSGFNDTSILTAAIDITGSGIQDDVLHGTIVSKIVSIYAPGSQIIGFKVSTSGRLDEINVLDALEQAYFNKVDVVNCSFEFPRDCDGSCAICQLIELLNAKGILVVAAAGNRGPAEGTIGCPGNALSALTIGAIDHTKRIAQYSSRGRRDQNKPDLLAPGSISYELYTGDGTSFAAPIITGIAASFLQTHRDHRLIKKCICGSATDLGYAANMQGMGLINIKGALEVLKNATSSGSVQG